MMANSLGAVYFDSNLSNAETTTVCPDSGSIDPLSEEVTFGLDNTNTFGHKILFHDQVDLELPIESTILGEDG